MAGLHGEKSDADLEREAAIWERHGHSDMAAVLREAKGSQQ